MGRPALDLCLKSICVFYDRPDATEGSCGVNSCDDDECKNDGTKEANESPFRLDLFRAWGTSGPLRAECSRCSRVKTFDCAIPCQNLIPQCSSGDAEDHWNTEGYD